MRKQASEVGNCVIRLNGQTLDPAKAAIVIPDDPTPPERYAARDLRHHRELVTGKLFDIVAEKDAKQDLHIGKPQESVSLRQSFEVRK